MIWLTNAKYTEGYLTQQKARITAKANRVTRHMIGVAVAAVVIMAAAEAGYLYRLLTV